MVRQRRNEKTQVHRRPTQPTSTTPTTTQQQRCNNNDATTTAQRRRWSMRRSWERDTGAPRSHCFSVLIHPRHLANSTSNVDDDDNLHLHRATTTHIHISPTAPRWRRCMTTTMARLRNDDGRRAGNVAGQRPLPSFFLSFSFVF
jgi:hypothetical protein